jgi:putative ABC transport system ATP-binding protein
MIIQAKRITKVFRTEMIETYALRELALNIDDGEFVTITGHSGCGKTTLLNILGLLEEFDHGNYWFDGLAVERLTDNQRSHIRNRSIGFVFQSFNLIPNLTIYENVEAPLLYRRMQASKRHEQIATSLDRVGLVSRKDHYPSQLSGGQQQRAAIARAISGSPRIILADEPTGNLDSTMSSQIMALLRVCVRKSAYCVS